MTRSSYLKDVGVILQKKLEKLSINDALPLEAALGGWHTQSRSQGGLGFKPHLSPSTHNILILYELRVVLFKETAFGGIPKHFYSRVTSVHSALESSRLLRYINPRLKCIDIDIVSSWQNTLLWSYINIKFRSIYGGNASKPPLWV